MTPGTGAAWLAAGAARLATHASASAPGTNPAIIAAWIAAGAGIVSVIASVVTSVISPRNTLKATKQTVEAGTAATMATLAAAREDRLWDKRAAAYEETLPFSPPNHPRHEALRLLPNGYTSSPPRRHADMDVRAAAALTAGVMAVAACVGCSGQSSYSAPQGYLPPSDPASCAAALATATAAPGKSGTPGPLSFTCACQTARAVWSTFQTSYGNVSIPAGKALAATRAAYSSLVIYRGYLSALSRIDLSNLGGSPAEAFENALSTMPPDFGKVSSGWQADDAGTSNAAYSQVQVDESKLGSLCSGPDVITQLVQESG